MIKITYTRYLNDFNRSENTKIFSSLLELENWIFGQMRIKYQRDYYAMYFPQDPTSYISFCPEYGGWAHWIHMIENENGIIFSDGKCTSGQQHVSIEIRQWLKHCNQRQNQPTYNFVD